jgi:uncharacterized protein (DUF58 family)
VTAVLVAAVLAAVLAVFYAVNSLFALASGLVFIWIAARILPDRALQQIEIKRTYPTRLFHGESAEVELLVSNRGRLPVPWLSLTEAVPFDLLPTSFRWATSLRGWEQRSARFRLVGSRRGIYRLGPATLVSGDPFGLVPAQDARMETERLVVYPKIIPLSRLGLPARAPFADLRTSRPLFEDPHRVIGVRPYAAGDSARRIHWTASAHQGSLLVRRLEHGIGRDTVVLLDLTRRGLGTNRTQMVELAVTAAASILYHIVSVEGLRAGLRMPGVTVTPGGDQGHLMVMLEVLAGATATLDDSRLTDPVGLPFGASVVLVTGVIEGRWLQPLQTMRHRGWKPMVLLIGDTTAPPVPGIPIWKVSAGADLIATLGGPE